MPRARSECYATWPPGGELCRHGHPDVTGATSCLLRRVRQIPDAEPDPEMIVWLDEQGEPMPLDPAEAEVAGDEVRAGDDGVECVLSVQIPRSWKPRVKLAARSHGMSMSRYVRSLLWCIVSDVGEEAR